MIISASRRSDIPAFFSEWFLRRIREGYALVRNPMNPRQISRVLLTPDVTDCIVFWTKNPIPLIPRLKELADYQYYFQFTLTPYGRDIEKNIPDKRERIVPAFRELAERIGPERVIWRYDPIIVTKRYTVERHLEAFEEIAGLLKGCTEKCVFSFVDEYRKNSKALLDLGAEELGESGMRDMAVKLRDIAGACGMKTATCSEKIDLDALGIDHNACIDKELVERICGGKIPDLKKYRKDQGQRQECKCMSSKDIGAANTCSNGCLYCYATDSAERVKRSMAAYDPASPILCDSVAEGEVITDAPDMKKWIQTDGQLSMFDLTDEG